MIVKTDLHLLNQQEQQLENIKRPKPLVLPSSLIGEETKSSASHFGSISETDEDTNFGTILSYANSGEAGVPMMENGDDGKNTRSNNIEEVDLYGRMIKKIDNGNNKNDVESDSVGGSTYGVEVTDALIGRNRFEQVKVGYNSAGRSICEQSALGSQYGTEVVFNPPANKKPSRKPRTLARHNMGVKMAANTLSRSANTTVAVKQHVMKATLAVKQTADSSPRRSGAGSDVKSQTKKSNLPLKKFKLGAKKSARTLSVGIPVKK